MATNAPYSCWAGVSPLHTLVWMLEAVLYILLVRWLVSRP